jgi:hypothetical protein
MHKIALPTALVASLLASGLAQAASPPVVVELFTSQGCSSCPPANAAVNSLADRSDVLALSFGVTYWDYLGWKDTFASAENTDRQWAYARALHHKQVWTPQVVVDGRGDTVGQSVGQIEPLIRQARSRQAGYPAITLTGDQVAVGPGSAHGKADVWLVRYDPRVVQVPIKLGENGGKTLPHRNVVKQMIKLGQWSGQAARFTVPAASDPNLRSAVLVQAGSGGPILSAARG